MTDDEDLSGAVKNGLERGQPVESVRNSLVGAGYDPVKVEAAIQKNLEADAMANNQVKSAPAKQQVPTTPVQVPASPYYPVAQTYYDSRASYVQPEMQKLPSNIVVTGGPSSKKIIITLLIILLILAGIGGILIWIFWDKIIYALT